MKASLNKRDAGFSLIEVMVSILILGVLVIGSSMASYQIGGNIQRQQNKREAIVQANAILERDYWNKTFSELDGSVGVSGTIDVNGRSMNYTTQLVSVDEDYDGINDYVEIRVDIDHMDAENDIVFVSRRYRHGLSRV
ncbi:MAG TPA: type II secretion system protein, partial [Pontiella sp.]